jgi:hypothetical protein
MSGELVKFDGGQLEIRGKKRDQLQLAATEKDLSKLMEELNVDELQKFVSEVEVVQVDSMKSLIYGLFNFMGFDPIEIQKRFLSIHKYYVEVQKIEGEDHETLIQDIILICAANLVMGNLQLKSKSRRSAKARHIIDYLITKYAIKSGTTGTGQPSDVITFPRAANAFPTITLRLASFLTPKEFPNKPFQTGKTPYYVRTSAFCGLLHDNLNSRTRNFLLIAVCAYSSDQSIVFQEGDNRKKKVKKGENEPDPSNIFFEQWTYVSAAADSPVPDLKVKKAMLTELRVEADYAKLKDCVSKAQELTSSNADIPTEAEFQQDLREFINSKG